MPTRTVRRLTTTVTLTLAALAWAPGAHAAGTVNIDSCQILSNPNTTYKLTTDLTSCGDCLVVAADRITVDLQDHSITNGCALTGSSGIGDEGVPRELVVVKNGAVRGFEFGVGLQASTRVSVLGIEASFNVLGITTGNAGLVMSSVARENQFGIGVGARSQVKQSEATRNVIGISAGEHCLITRNIANDNQIVGIGMFGDRGILSFNTTNSNGFAGIAAGPRALITLNMAIGNGLANSSFTDFEVRCPSVVTFNTSTNGFPASYDFRGSPPCKTAHNE